MNKLIPCKDCLIIPICRTKTYGQLLHGCKLLTDILYNLIPPETCVGLSKRRGSYPKDIRKVEKTINPIRWQVSEEHQTTLIIGKKSDIDELEMTILAYGY